MYALPDGHAVDQSSGSQLLGKLLRSQKAHFTALGDHNACIVQSRHSRILGSGEHISDAKLAIVKSELFKPSDRKSAVGDQNRFLARLAPRQGPG